MTINEWLSQAVQELQQTQTGSEQLDAELILGHVLGHDRSWLKAHHADPLTHDHAHQADKLIHRRANHEPLVHLTGHREFYGLDFEITPDVLTPRIETEQMVEWAIKYAPPRSRLIDIGTGSGAIAIAIAKHRPDLDITATEVSQAALTIAERNAKRHGVKLTFVQSNLWQNVTGQFETVVTNLPYLRDDAASELMPEVQREPAIALFGGADGLDLYRRFLRDLPVHLTPGGHLFTECDPWQHAELITTAAQYHLQPIQQGYFILGFQAQS